MKVQPRWLLEDSQRPWTMNAERSWHWSKRASRTRETRERFGWLALEKKIPKLKYASIDIIPITETASSLADVAACYPAAKAAIDGIVDVGIIPDDSGKYLKSITFWSPQVLGYEGLRLVITKEERKEYDHDHPAIR
tara:strand:- start:527 stop:937 length:411 start_codon:yes stop_codon:yes gene_type:complete